MPESLQSVVLGAGLAPLGVIVTSLLGLLQTALARRWSLHDTRRAQRLQVSDRRIDQAEKYLEAITADFRDLMHDIEYHLAVDDLELSRARRDARRRRKDLIDLTVFAKGPALRSLGDDALVAAYEGMMSAYDKMADVYKEVGRKLELGEDVDPNAYRRATNHAWKELAKHLADAYSRLDQIRIARAN